MNYHFNKIGYGANRSTKQYAPYLRTSIDRFLVGWSMRTLSDYQGTALPTVGTFQGMIAYRSDQDKLYQLKTMPNTWVNLQSDYFLFDFDNHAVSTSLPERPLVGLKDFSMRCSNGLFLIQTMVVFTLYNEPNLGKHNKFLGQLFEDLYPNKTIPVQRYTDNSGTTFDLIKIMEETEVLPPINANTRVIQAVGFAAGTGLTST